MLRALFWSKFRWWIVRSSLREHEALEGLVKESWLQQWVLGGVIHVLRWLMQTHTRKAT